MDRPSESPGCSRHKKLPKPPKMAARFVCALALLGGAASLSDRSQFHLFIAEHGKSQTLRGNAAAAPRVVRSPGARAGGSFAEADGRASDETEAGSELPGRASSRRRGHA